MWSCILVFSLLGLLDLSSAQLIQFGQCNQNIQLVEDFNVTQFIGKWYGVARTNSVLQSADCSTLELTPAGNGFTVVNDAVNNNFLERIEGTATLQAGTARFTLSLNAVNQPVDFWILSTDYENFALAYACEPVSTTQRRVYIWQLGRAPEFPNVLMPVLMNQTLSNLLGITLDNLNTIEHSERACYVLPDIPAGESIILPGQCDPNLPVLQSFNPARFTGVWHGIASYPTVNQQGVCGRAEYSLNGTVVNIANSEVVNQTLRVITGTAVVTSTDGSARLRVNLEVVPGVFSDAELFVLASDYDNFAVSYNCVNLPNNQRKVISWILGRSRTLSDATQRAVDAVVASYIDLNYRYFIQSDQSEESCFYFPEPVPDVPVVFRGQCNMSIPTVQDFDAARYSGLWHTIEAYPSVWEGGSCNNARYSLGDGVVDVLNTQVVDQGLDTMVGTARVVSTDGSAKLDVTFPVAGTNQTVTISYWVLDTDYSSYSLVYTCQNTGSDNMQVWSWKLSRQKSLTTAATEAINRVIATVQVLDARYYVAKDQSDAGCFYFPEPQPGVTVVFPGRCDETIPVVNNFNMNSFQGVWYEYQAYPEGAQQCVSHTYTAGAGDTLSVVSSGVTDQFLGVSSGALSFSSVDGSGRLILTTTTDTGNVSFPYWILAVNYSDYAFAYRCVDLEDDHRAIFSWKLTRTQGALSAAANTAINNIMNTNVVLDQSYFEDISQSEEACYTLPDLPLGVPVVIPGQCDPDIPVVQNFNVTRYTGLWRLIETYYAEFQSGTCNEATYTLDGTGVTVFNTHVVNQTLLTITGSATLASDDGSAKLLVTFPNRPGESEYWVLDTDYDSYALVYSCVNLNALERRVWSWKLSRSNQLSETAETNINRVVNSVRVLNNRFYQRVDRSDDACLYFPEPDPAAPVIFRGQCDESIPVVTNFNAVRYMGLWHNIESYPTPFQGGTCNNAYYTLVGGAVDVFNTQVIDQTLDTINGVARLVPTNDTSAKLIVSFPISGTNLTTETPYWVLGTDYDTYAFVYTCVNLDSYRRQVYSWKLSRTKQLTANADNLINSIAANIPVLQQQYFVDRNQTAEGCFYFPEPRPGGVVQFPGQCDNTIQAVPNFNLTAFVGVWYEIEAYPKEQQTGQCVDHTYTPGAGNTLNLVSSSVTDLSLNLTTSTVAITSTDGSGRLTITINTGGSVVTIPFWVIATDYTDYALAYACENTQSDFRAVYSWKLSRTKQLSAAANVSINNRMADIVVLENRYFEPIDQSDDACFYLPEREGQASIVFRGQCDPNITVVQNFNATRYTGTWRLIESYPNRFQGGTCQDATYTLNGTEVVVHNTQVVNRTLATITGSAVLASTDGSAKLLVTFPRSPIPADYWVLDTDYDSYALVYSCRNLNSETRAVNSWKLSRTADLTPVAIANINRVVESINVLDDRYYDIMDQSDAGCLYLPAPDPTAAPVFRGQCDETIPVVTDFDAVRYMGLWHNTESYPTRFQGGTCNNAYYTLVGGAVDVFNTQVIDQTLDTINGVATLEPSDDGSAKLIVSFPVSGTNLTTETPYWVLGTDYDTYALVYTCVNLDNNRRQVYSWKLSRTKQLTANADNLINGLMANIPVLQQQYFVDRNQTAEGCFYFPEPRPGVVVEFPGQCDNTIQAVPNFNLTAFEGVWYEIEAYPKEQQTGQCVDHTYTPGAGNTLNLVSSSVTDLSLNLTTSTVAITSTDGSGRLTITINTGGSVVTIPFWVIATDYTDYALAYACENTRSDFRAVYSWKLSRTKQLSAAANVSINNRMADIVVLENRYFEPIDQSDDACFYLPEREGQASIVFRGQCDPNITVVQNFNATRYTGTWRLIESYPNRFQGGTCQDATYTLNGTEVVVHNTQVVNRTLATITGSAVLASTDGSAKLLVTFPRSPIPADYWVLDTDYDSYALVYSCRNLNSETRAVNSWKLSRTADLTPVAIANINRVVESINVLDDRYYDIMDQSDAGCLYLPAPDPTAAPVFRGQCDETIPVVTDFDAVRYMGLWHNTESYPTRFQGGTCNNAYYTLVGGAVDVFNTQVIDQTLFTINGVATLEPSNDGSAKLIVSFPVSGTNLTTETPYWVLGTDYDTYALVYTCVNLANNRRQVYSWKLSRTKQLTANADNLINGLMANIPVLQQQYFVDRNQTAEGCFYFPEPRPGVVVEFPGQCDNTIQAVPNFNLTAFIGMWHEIEAYPKAQQTGQCVNHEYSQGTGNTLNLVSTSVLDLSLDVTYSNVAITSTDGSGRLSIVLTANDTTVTIPFWILDTDYTTYALAYSCVNTRSDFRAVYSWKLSRTRALTPAAAAAIDNAIEPIEVLDNRYYERIDQSDDACLYLPNLGPNDPVVFRGQCDPNITVVRDFDPVRYASRWRLIETYYAEQQSGSCNQATYTLLPNSTVLVYNTKVNNETLQSIEGTAVLATTDGSGKLLVTFPGTAEPAEYWVLDTDYDSYALVYACRNLNSEQRRVWSWKLSRTRELSATAVTNINRIVNGINVLDAQYYQVVDHSDEACFYYPVPDGNPVTFRGQCNDSIPVVTNFDAQRYMGKWYDIQSYPQRFQYGTCSTANYTLSDRGVEVFNTQVIAQQLDTINGIAVPASGDGSAKLIVSFPIAGTDMVTNTPYWVLTTDYDSYALVYSCTNLDEETRRVTSWQLSRTRNLTANAVAEFNRVMDTVPVLRQDYFGQRGHSDDDCFYYPDNAGGPVVLDGQCVGDQDVVTNFRPADFAGTWYETARFPSDLQTGECVTNTLTASGNTIALTATVVYNERLVTVAGTATPAADGRGVLTARLTGGGVTIEKTIYILSTDYTDHALLFSCSNLNSYSKQIYSWKLARSRDGFSAASNATINGIVSSNVDLFEGYYEPTDLSDNGCFYYPVFTEPPTDIILPGPCDERIRGKPNFDAGAYLGRWIELASYPQAFQFGECSRAEYIAAGDAVRVVNSQVVGQRLDIMIGSAAVASTDGSGVLNVTFAFDNGVVTVANYYILETDYTSFALVYSCRNLTENRRQVTSWKLSRTRSLSNEANAVMDRIIGETQGLLADYYTPTRQDEDACFYVPEINRDEAPRFRGQCGSVTGVQNFNAQRYVGWWHEIERYPSDHAVGECISSEFRAAGNQFEIVDTNVFGVTAQVNTSTVAVSNDGRLRKTYSNGRVEDIWVLATDYDTYSLLYSCENIDDEYMRVWSAKHSKTRSLTAAAQDAMAQVINNTRDLVSDFYLAVNQSDDACFHYPEQTGRRVILPGQCDPNIPVVQSFDAGEYTGTWFQIERYPQFYESGNCTGARYTLNENTGVISVTNWQVIDGALDVVEGTANVTSADGSARLRVRLPVRGTDDPNPPMSEMDLWVLSTDYISYSLVYSCSNVDQFTRAVGAWKLSRTRTMPDAGNTAINNYMATRQELHQPFFLQIGQSDDCEQPSSGTLVKSSIIFILVCAMFQLLL